ncbi:Putative sodium-dependent mannose transporter [Fulvivirga imtechensis AK7]|uniref:Putative sodium-dependent mannose transporter n=1 Tax=Fulvivirga imtechensis AK7 TaxID=1237149 RepID=L8JT55_9BACT|nr:sodium:solute symporter family protein [Fulvivirga imtechensis]ELR72156.1 Putative sodium-dependent mannose transporter [Fulvivirga imtechensis AK7]
MKLEAIDIIIIVGYLVLTIALGFYFSKKASKDLQAYFLGGKTIPWWILGISNASGMFDITGTMWLVSMCFVYGLKSAWLPWIWPTFNQVFLMVYLSVWLRRSNVMTGAEWLEKRFGNGRGAELSQLVVVVFALVSVVGFIAYTFKGIGKFAHTFLPWDFASDTYALILISITSLYVIKGGMYSVVITELIQFIIMTIASIAVGIIAMNLVSPEMLSEHIPEGWKELFFGWHLDLDWSGVIASVNQKISEDGFTWFSFFVMMMLFKGVLVSMAGPVPNYDMQRILATKTPKDAAKMSGLVSLVMYFPRYMLVTGLTILALVFLGPKISQEGGFDFEMILPYSINNFIPAGFTGLLLAGLIAAFMSTYAATVNAAPVYFVNDIYKKYIKPDGSRKLYVRMSYLASFVIIVLGIAFGFVIDSINSITQWIFGALFGGYTAANLLKWYWWRFNGYGYFWGMMAGLGASLVLPFLFPEVQPLYAFPFILLISLFGSIGGSLLTKPDNEDVLIDFYKSVRPWGWWGPVKRAVMERYPEFTPNKNADRDAFNIIVGIIWQLTLVVMPIYLVIRELWPMLIAFGVFAITSIILKKNWLDKLEND